MNLEGTSWTRGATIIEFSNDAENNDFGYPWMVPLDDDRWWCTFYHGKNHGPSSIYGLTLTSNDLLG